MTHMFDNYPQPSDYIPTNIKIKVPNDEAIIMPGETTVHSFEIPFDVDKTADDYKIIYKLGLDVILEKGKDKASVVKDATENFSILSWVLSPEETLLFKNTLLQAQTQIKFVMKDGTVAYSEISQIKVEDSLDIDEPLPPVPPHVITGIGYTED